MSVNEPVAYHQVPGVFPVGFPLLICCCICLLLVCLLLGFAAPAHLVRALLKRGRAIVISLLGEGLEKNAEAAGRGGAGGLGGEGALDDDAFYLFLQKLMLVGDRVSLHGLSRAAHLNGMHGSVAVVSGAGSGGRIEVALDNGTNVKVLGKNLAFLPR